MRKKLHFSIIILFICLLAGCAGPQPANKDETSAGCFPSQNPVESESQLSRGTSSDPSAERLDDQLMSFPEFLSAENSCFVCIESYLQEKESWIDGRINAFLQDESGAYYVYGLKCSQEDYTKLDIGQKLRIEGYKSDFSGEIQITDAVYTVLDGRYIADPVDVSPLLGTDDLYRYLNQSVSLTSLKIEPMFDGVSPFFYGWDNSGSIGNNSDLYFMASNGVQTGSFIVNSKLCDSSSDVYNKVQQMKIGDVIDLKGIVFWYNGPQIRVTALSIAPDSR